MLKELIPRPDWALARCLFARMLVGAKSREAVLRSGHIMFGGPRDGDCEPFKESRLRALDFFGETTLRLPSEGDCEGARGKCKRKSRMGASDGDLAWPARVVPNLCHRGRIPRPPAFRPRTRGRGSI